MQNVSKSRIGCYPVLTLLWLGVIWGHSLQPAAVSSQESGAVLSGLSALLEALCLPPFLTETLVRKGAHMAEYLVLAALLTGSLRNRDRTGRGLCAGVLSASLFCALIRSRAYSRVIPSRFKSRSTRASSGASMPNTAAQSLSMPASKMPTASRAASVPPPIA